MADYPDQVKVFHQALYRFRGVMEVNTGLKPLDKIPVKDYALPGKMGDLPHALLYRTQGGLANEAWANTDVILSYDRAGWLTLEFLAWWVREQSRSGEQIQMRPQALSPVAGENIQLGQTLKFVVDHFCILSDQNPEAMLTMLAVRGNSLSTAIERHADVLGDLLVEETTASDISSSEE
ncbi:hypothetical protein N836_05865 [Leptolyngbya sp. Heron Island J]|uniref:hypothetical protein n=1 Tax=Leptolyngbya sp. Heron Island J TaxID=1385935 RepID=UPI0003B9BC6F|nr:hypothetical protein [Leptolyngbya sp. Heron Island J]ESA36762.1 hypothetical protein N836_05865 [Leptolyngbya sp. Heron Island J]